MAREHFIIQVPSGLLTSVELLVG